MESNSKWIGLLVAAVAAGGIARAAEPVRLEEVLRIAVARAKADDARLRVAQGNLHLLESLNKTRIEFSPSLGLFAFSNPLLLAANIGGGLLFNRRTAPSPVTIQSARLDVVEAELASAALRVRTEIEAARLYFALLEKQQVAARTRDLRQAQLPRLIQADTLLETGRITAVDRLACEQEALDLEWHAVETEAQRKLAAVQLAVLMGMPERAGNLAVEDEEVMNVSGDRPLPPVEQLLRSALAFRTESRLMRERIESLARQLAPPGRVQLGSFSASSVHAADTLGGLANTATGTLLRGNAARTEFNFRISLRDTGEKAAAQELIAARVRMLEFAAAEMEDGIRAEILLVESSLTAGAEKLRIASRRLELARQAQQLVAARVQYGLADVSARQLVERSLLEAETGYAQAACERKANLFALLALCGLRDQPAEVRENTLAF
ncbi:MAG: TolC family protein [Acidobacteria bacterium]|nr:TolC family protein [Acidobacteriota bacterium]